MSKFMFIRVEHEKKNIPPILTKFGGVVRSLSETIQKKFELPRWRARRAEGSHRAPSFGGKRVFFFCFFQLVKMARDIWNSAKKVQFECLHLSEPLPSFSDQNSDLYPEVKKLQIVKIESFYFSKKCN